jgi:transposase InsO family protein
MPGRTYPVELKLRAVREVLEEGAVQQDVARIFGVPGTTLSEWLRRYRRGGLDALLPPPPPVPPPPRPSPKREAVSALKREHPEYGTRRIRDVLKRFEALGVSESEVRRILHEEGLLEEREPTAAREQPERRFERAQPNELWQSDIFTFLLRRHERLYLAAFLDDHSRFVVGQAVAHHQRAPLVLEALDRAIAGYGTPREVLTDQGRQYTAWRGTTAFEEELRRQGIRHLKSRPQHPQTLGKIERFWKTLWDEFLSRTVFADFADCARRLGLFVDGYNFQRPHQGLSGLVPADRFFRSAPQVRAAVERSVAANALRLAQEKPPLKPFYLVGRLGDRDLSIAASAEGLRVKVGNEEETIELGKESDDEHAEEAKRAEAPPAAPVEDGPEVDHGAAGARRDGEEEVPARPLGPLGGEAGDRRDRGERDVAEHLLPDGRAGARGDAGSAGADTGTGAEAGPGGADRGAGGEALAAGAGEAAGGAVAPPHAEGGEERPADLAGPGPAALDDGWRETFDRLGDEDGGREPFDPEAGWRGRALSWDRKLAGANAGSEALPEEAAHGEEGLRAGTGGPAGAAAAVRDDAPGARGGDLGERGGEAPWPFPEPLPDAAPPGDEGDADRARARRAGAAGEAGAGGGARGEGGEARAGERAAPGPGGDDRPAPGSGERGDPGPGPGVEAEEGDGRGGER